MKTAEEMQQISLEAKITQKLITQIEAKAKNGFDTLSIIKSKITQGEWSVAIKKLEGLGYKISEIKRNDGMDFCNPPKRIEYIEISWRDDR